MVIIGYFKRFLEARFSNPDSDRALRAKEEASYMHFLDFLEKYEGRNLTIIICSLILYQLNIFLLQYIGDYRHVFLSSEGTIHTVDGMTVTLQHLLIFCTGADREPPLGFHKQAVLEFLHTGVLSTASMCDLIFLMPTSYHDNYAKFKEMMVESLISGLEFGHA